PKRSFILLRAFGHLLFCVPQHLRSIDVLPPGGADVDSADFVISRHYPNSVSQTAIALPTIGLRAFEIIKDFKGTHKQTSINRIELPQMFTDAGDPVSARFDFHGVF